MWHWLAVLTAPALAHELEVTKDRLRESEAQNVVYERMVAEFLEGTRKERPMSEENETQPIAGRVVEGAGNVAESAVRQVEGAAVEATEFLSDSVLARAIGLIRAAKTIGVAGGQGTMDIASEGGDLLLRELDEFREAVEQAVKDAAGGESK